MDVYSLNVEHITQVVSSWYAVLSERYERLIAEGDIGGNTELLLMIVQNNDIARKIGGDFDLMEQFNEMISRYKGLNFAVIFTNYQNTSLSYDAPEPLQIIKQNQHLIFFQNLDELKVFEAPYEEIKANRRHLEVGDAYYIQDNMFTKLKLVKARSEDSQ